MKKLREHFSEKRFRKNVEILIREREDLLTELDEFFLDIVPQILLTFVWKQYMI